MRPDKFSLKRLGLWFSVVHTQSVWTQFRYAEWSNLFLHVLLVLSRVSCELVFTYDFCVYFVHILPTHLMILPTHLMILPTHTCDFAHDFGPRGFFFCPREDYFCPRVYFAHILPTHACGCSPVACRAKCRAKLDFAHGFTNNASGSSPVACRAKCQAK